MLLPWSSHLNCMTLREWSLFFDLLKKEFLPWGRRLWANTKDNGTSLPEKCVLFLYLSRKGFITLQSRRAAQPPKAQPPFPRPEPRGTKSILLTQIPPSQQWDPHLSSHQLIPTAPQGLRPGQGKLASKVVKGMTHKEWTQCWGRSRVRRTRAAVVITRGRQGSLDWCPDPGKQECAADILVWLPARRVLSLT